MAIERFGGFENSQDDEIEVQTGSVVVGTSPAPPQAKETYSAEFAPDPLPDTGKMLLNGKLAIDISTNDKLTIGMYIRFKDVSPASDHLFFYIEGGSNTHLSLYKNTTGKIDVRDATGTSKGTSSALSANTWYLLELEVHVNDSGSVKLYLDEVLEVDVTGDFFDTSGTLINVVMSVFPNVIQNPNYYLASFYIFSGSTQPARIGPYSVLIYGYDEVTATPNVTGVDLDSSTLWSHSSEIPGNDTNKSTYTGNGDSGVVETNYSAGAYTAGPKGDSRIGVIKAGSWIARSQAVGFSPVAKLKYGAGDGTDGTVETDITGTSTHQIFDDATIMPTASEYFQYGLRFGSSSGSVNLWDMWCNILNQEFNPAKDNSFKLEQTLPVEGPQVPLAF